MLKANIVHIEGLLAKVGTVFFCLRVPAYVAGEGLATDTMRKGLELQKLQKNVLCMDEAWRFDATELKFFGGEMPLHDGATNEARRDTPCVHPHTHRPSIMPGCKHKGGCIMMPGASSFWRRVTDYLS